MALRFGNSGVRFGAGRPARLGGTPPARAGLGKLLLGVPGTFLCGFPKGREAAMAKAEQRAENLESGKNFEQSHLTNHIPVIRKTPFACFAFFVVETNQNHRVLPRKSGRLHHSITPRPQISPPDQTTAPKDSFQ